MAKTLKISDTLALPLDYATKTAAILAQRRKGKTYTASVIAEEMVAAKQPFVALDPTGAWWGLRAGVDGAPGLPVVILGGQHGDVPLERTAGRLIADLVVDSPGYYVIDFSLFESGEAERQFAVDFAERLYRAKAQPGKNFPLHLFVDEADRFIPQSLTNKSETSPRLLGAFEAIVRRGGLRGLGTTLISQRAAVVNKNVLEMLDVLIALRTIGPNDQKAVKGYVQAHGSEKELADIMGSLASLAIGEAWFWEPGADLIQRVQIRKRRTFNSSATPDTAERTVEPKQLAPVDLAALTVRMKDTIERAKADDPKELRRQLAAAKKELEIVQAGRNSTDRYKNTPDIPKPALTDADRELLKDLRAAYLTFSEDIGARADAMLSSLAERAKAMIDEALKKWTDDVDKRRQTFSEWHARVRIQKLIDKVEQLEVHHAPGRVMPTPSPGRPPAVSGTASRLAPRTVPAVASGESLKPGQQAILDLVAALKQRGIPSSVDAIAAWLDLHPNGGTFRGNVRALNDLGYLAGAEITETGRASARAIPTGVDAAKQKLKGGQLAIFETIEAEAKPLTVEQLGATLNLHPNGGTFRGNIRRLVRMGLITSGQMRVTDGARR